MQEIARIEQDVSRRAAERAEYFFRAFQKWVGKDIDLPKIDTQMLDHYQRARLQKVSADTTWHEIDALVRLLRANGLSIIKPRRRHGRRIEQREFTNDELARFFAHCPPKIKPLFLLLLATGARPAEIIPSKRSCHIALLKRDLNHEQGTVTIRPAKLESGQKGTERMIPIPEYLMEMVLEVARQTPGPHVFEPIVRLSRPFDQVCKDAAIPKVDELGRKVTAHSFRHTYATIAARMMGDNPFLVKQILVHSQIATTDRYCHPVAPAIVIDLVGMGVKNGCQKSIE